MMAAALFSLILSVPSGKVVVLCGDGLSWPDVASKQAPYSIWEFFQRASVGLLNTGVLGLKTRSAVYATMGAGAKSAGLLPDKPLEAAEPAELLPEGAAGDVYRQRMGEEPPPRGVVVLSLPALLEANKKGQSTATPGLLGEEIHKVGLKTALVGHADTPEMMHREPSLLVADSMGRVDIGRVGVDILSPSPEAPFGTWLNLERLKRAADEALKEASLIVVDFGDTYRAEKQAQSALEEVAERHKRRSLQRCAKFLKWLEGRLDPQRDLLIFLSGLPPRTGGWPRDRLTFVALLGKGFEGGLLTSESTRRPGLVAAVDLAPTILHFFGLKAPLQVEGLPMKALPFDGDKAAFLTALERRADVNYMLRLPVVKGFIYLVAFVLVLGLVALFYGRPGARWVYIVDKTLLAFMAVPLALLVQPLMAPPSIPAFAVSLLALVGLLTFLAKVVEERWGAGVAFVGLLTTLAVVVDSWAGARLNGGSVMSYHPAVGARFYGIGNEYMGIVVASTLVGLGCLLDRAKPASSTERGLGAASFAMFFVLLSIGLPQVGANLGGAITAAVGFGLFAFKALGVKVRLKQALLLILGAIALAALVSVLDLLLGGGTHLGRAARLATHGEWKELLVIAWRKLSTNIRLFKSVAWSRLLLVFVIVLAVLLHRPRGLMASMLGRRRWFGPASVSSIVAMLVAIVVNDSGVVACATMITIVGPALMHMLLREVMETRWQKVSSSSC